MPFVGEQYSKELECPVCLDLLDDPVELNPCKHLFCRKDVPPQICPSCRARYSSTSAPNRVILNMIMSATVKCEECAWVGTKENSATHRCQVSANPPESMQGKRPSVVAASVPRPQPSIPQVTYGGRSGQRRAIIPNTGREPWKAYGLNQMDFDQIVAIFVNFDGDDSQELDRSELKKLARYLNYAHSDQDIEKIFMEMDADHSGSLSLEEFCTWLANNKPDPQTLYGLSQFEYNTVLMQFHEHDDDHSGELTLAQFQKLCHQFRYTSSPQESQQMFFAIDQNHSGGIDLHEFLTYLAHRRQEPSRDGRHPAPAPPPSAPLQHPNPYAPVTGPNAPLNAPPYGAPHAAPPYGAPHAAPPDGAWAAPPPRVPSAPWPSATPQRRRKDKEDCRLA